MDSMILLNNPHEALIDHCHNPNHIKQNITKLTMMISAPLTVTKLSNYSLSLFHNSQGTTENISNNGLFETPVKPQHIFQRDNLFLPEPFFDEHVRKHVYLAGIETDSYLFSTALQLQEKKFPITLVSNGISTMDPEYHRHIIQKIKQKTDCDIITI